MSQDGQQGAQHAPTATPPMPAVPATELYRGAPRLLRFSDVRHSIGWQDHRAAGPCFVVVRLTMLGDIKVLSRFPLSPDGWDSAWQALAELDADAATAVSATMATLAARRASELDPDTLARLIYMTYDGGSSSASLVKGQAYDLRFLSDRLTVFPSGTASPVTELPYQDIENVEVGGSGSGRSSGEAIAVISAAALGGALLGFLVLGLLGLFLGALLVGLVAAVALAGAAKAKTIVRLRSRDAEFFFSKAEGTPESLRIALSQPLLAIESARGASPRESAGQTPLPSGTATDQLGKLASLLADGLLSREEFEQLKARVIAQS